MPSPATDEAGGKTSLRVQLTEALRCAGLSCDTYTVTNRSVLVATAGSMSPMCITITSCRLITMAENVVVIHFGIQPHACIGHGDVQNEILEIGVRRSNDGPLAWFAIVKDQRGRHSSVPLAQVEL
jgi:hypothetical protein